LLLYFVFSPFGLDAFAQGAKVVMKNAGLRYWAVEHATVMLLAVILAQVGRTKSKRARAHKQKFKHAFVFFLISLILMLSRIPWHESARLFLREPPLGLFLFGQRNFSKSYLNERRRITGGLAL
jgi:hypothetical protein